MPFYKRSIRPQSPWGNAQRGLQIFVDPQNVTTGRPGLQRNHGNRLMASQGDNHGNTRCPTRYLQPGSWDILYLDRTWKGCLVPGKALPILPRSSVKVQEFNDVCIRNLVTLILQMSDLSRLSLSLFEELEDQLQSIQNRIISLHQRTGDVYWEFCKSTQCWTPGQNPPLAKGKCYSLSTFYVRWLMAK